jgi:hypothetical protein
MPTIRNSYPANKIATNHKNFLPQYLRTQAGFVDIEAFRMHD